MGLHSAEFWEKKVHLDMFFRGADFWFFTLHILQRVAHARSLCRDHCTLLHLELPDVRWRYTVQARGIRPMHNILKTALHKISSAELNCVKFILLRCSIMAAASTLQSIFDWRKGITCRYCIDLRLLFRKVTHSSDYILPLVCVVDMKRVDDCRCLVLRVWPQKLSTQAKI